MEENTKKLITQRQFQRTAALDPRCKVALLIMIGCVSYFLNGEICSLVLVASFALFIAVGNGGKWAAKMLIFYIVIAYLNALLRYVSIPVLSVIMSVFGVTILKLVPIAMMGIRYNGKKLSPRQRRNLSYLVMQDTDYQLFGSSVEEELSLGIENDCSGKVTETLEALELGAYRECHPASLSGGQKQRVTIGAAIVKDSPVIYFDEPTSGLDYDSMVRVSHLIEQLAAAGVIIFIVSHDFEFITRTCSEVLQLDGQDSIKNQVLTPEILLSLSKQYFN